MRAGMSLAPTLETGTLTANATFQDPDVRLAGTGDDAPAVRIEEGGVIVVLEFPDLDCLTRFVRRLARLPVPGRGRT
jgi:hypothetical protein